MKTIKEVIGDLPLWDFLERCHPSKGGDGFKFFAEKVLGLDIQPFHQEWVQLFLDNQFSCIMAPRQHGKTECLAVAFPIWMSLFKRDQNILIVTNAMHLSTDILRRLKNHIYNNELLTQLKSRTWTKTSIITSTNCKIECKPYSNTVRGGSYHYVLPDEAGTYQDKDIFYSAIVPTVAKTSGHICVIGTPLSETDLLSELQNNEDYVQKSYPAEDDKGNLLWPDAYTRTKLDKIKNKIGALRYAREFLLRIQDEEQQVFPPSVVLRALDKELPFELQADTAKRYYMGWDLAMSPKGDYTVGFVVSKNNRNDINIVNIIRTQGLDYSGHKQLILDTHNTYHPVKTLIDSSVFGQVLITDLIRDNRIFVEGFSFVPENRNNAINNLIRLFETSRIYLPFKCKTGHELGLIDMLRKELSDMTISFTKAGARTYKTLGRHDDMVMSLSLACFAADSVQQRTSGMMVSQMNTGTGVYDTSNTLGLMEQDMISSYADENLGIW